MIKKTYWIFCDGCGGQFALTDKSLRETRKATRYNGWTYSKTNGDKCENCTKEELKKRRKEIDEIVRKYGQ